MNFCTANLEHKFLPNEYLPLLNRGLTFVNG
jgi:hypothetical protein